MIKDINTKEKAEELFNMALEYYLGIARDKNLIKAKELLEQAAELGSDKSSILLGDLYIKKILQSDNYKEAYDLYKKGCKHGDCRSFSRLAMCYEKGYGIEKNIVKSLELYEKSTTLGNKGACFSIARIYEKGHGVKKDLSKAFNWYFKGADLGDAECACNLAFCYYKGIGTIQNIDKAKDLFLLHSEYNALIQKNLGVIYYKGTPKCKPNEKEAIRWLTKAAENGDVTSMLYLGKIFRESNIDQALEWYQKAAAIDSKEAAYKYGFFLYKKNQWDDSFKWMQLSAENKYTAAQFMLGLFYKCGIGTPVNHTKAFFWFNLAAENEYEQAYSHIGRYYREGRLVSVNYETALSWFEKAIRSSDINVKSEALYDYGIMYMKGLGLKKNEKKGLDYLLESSKLGCLNAINKLKEFKLEKICRQETETNVSYIIDHGNILDFVEWKIKDEFENTNWKPNADKRLMAYIQVAKDYGLVKKNKEGKWLWTLNNKDYAQWILDVSDDIGLYILMTKDGKEERNYFPTRFSRLFLTKSGKEFKPIDLRSYMSSINRGTTSEVRNAKKLMDIRNKSRQEVKRLLL